MESSLRGDERITRALNTSLRIPRANRTVADFLFTDLTINPFHKAYILPPTAWSNVLTISSASKVSVNQNPNYTPASGQLPMPKQFFQNVSPDGVAHASEHLSFIPIAYIPPYTLGYSFNYEPGESIDCLAGNPFLAPRVSRFVFDSTSLELLITVCGGKPASIGLLSMLNVSSTLREQRLISVPPIPYEWPYLPTVCMWMASIVDCRTPYFASVSEPVSQDLLSIDSLISSNPLPSHSSTFFTPVSSRQPWILSESGRLSDGTSIVPPQSLAVSQSHLSMLKDSPQSMEGTSGASFSLHQVTSILPLLSKAISGSFYCPSVRMDLPNPNMATNFISTFSGRVSCLYYPSDKPAAFQMRQRFAMEHYHSVLSVSSDQFLALATTSVEQERPPSIPTSDNKIDSSGQFNNYDDLEEVIHDIISTEEASTDCTDAAIDEVICTVLNDSMNLELKSGKEISGKFTKSSTNDNFLVNPNVGQIPYPSCSLGFTEKVGSLSGEEQRRAVPIVPRTAVHLGAYSLAGVEVQVETTLGSPEGGKSNQQHCTLPDKERILAERRKRNRLSAARSNERKKAWILALEKNLVQEKKRADKLSEKRRLIEEENRALKARLTYLNL